MTATERFAQARPRLLRLAYSELGDVGEAEDVVQEAWVRLQRADRDAIANLDGWLTTVVARLALDRLHSARARRETYVGPWLPEPLMSEDPTDRVTLDESVSYALLTVLEQLSPAERTAFVCTTCSTCRLATSPRWWAAPLRRFGSLRRARAATSSGGARAFRPRAANTIAPCARSRRRWPTATWRTWSRCSTRRSSGRQTAAGTPAPRASR